jgi:3-oxoacyl-[acyl-carrier-protein] synthase I
MAEAVVIVGVGMLTAVGLSAAETAASVRAGVAMFTETHIRDRRFEPITLAEIPDDAVPPLAEDVAAIVGLTSRERRLVRLAAPALLECLVALAGTEVRPPLILSMPETVTRLPLDPRGFLQWLARQAGDVFDAERSDAIYAGRAGGLHAIDRAASLIRLGRATFAIGGGIETYRDPYVLATLDMEQRLKSTAHADGFIPGEGAGFVLLTSESGARRAKLTPLGSVSALAQGAEPGHFYSELPYRGEGLAAVVRDLVDGGEVASPIREVYSSMNGESHWAKEWGVAFIRNKAAFAEEHGFHHPADCYGDTGAASGPLLVALAALGIRSGHRASPAMVYCSSDRGDRAALTIV